MIVFGSDDHAQGRTKRLRSWVYRYFPPVVAVAVATWVRLLLDPILGDRFPFVTVFLATLLCS